jgi:thiol-disulfide isomerase/thioredoxin
MNRRKAIQGAAWAAATGGAAALGSWTWHRQRSPDAQAPSTAELPWSLRLERPDGGWLNMADLRGRPLVLNFWATWCPPCVEELPEIDRFHREHNSLGWQVVGLAVDSPGPVRQFLARQPVSFPVGLAGLAGTDLARALGNHRGSLPFTVVFNRKGQVIQRKLGQTSHRELSQWAKTMDGR